MDDDDINQDLQKRLEEKFKPLGIVAYSNCCRLGCTGTYGEDYGFQMREKGILFFRLHLNGMNYREHPKTIPIIYDDYNYLIEHWNEECDLIKEWCSTVGANIEKIEKPLSNDIAIKLSFTKHLNLEKMKEDLSDEQLKEKFNKEVWKMLGNK